MKPKRLTPIRDREVYADLAEKQIVYSLYTAIFKPILEIFGLSLMPQNERKNDKTNLATAILAGRVVFHDGVFRGKFSASISKELKDLGGKFYPKQNAWRIDRMKLPVEVNQAITRIKTDMAEKVKKAIEHLDKIQAQEYTPVMMNTVAEGILDDLSKQFEQTTADEIEIPMAMAGYIEDNLKTKYNENMNLYIKGWTEESIVRLREKITENSMQGYRAEGMRQAIIDEYGVSERKAKFLARQETSLMVSKYREEHYKETGINFYQWSSSHDGRVRDSHKDLNGRIFSWNDPPIVDPVTGRRGHPGEDFGCRCVAVPVLMSQMERITEMAKQGKPFTGSIAKL